MVVIIIFIITTTIIVSIIAIIIVREASVLGQRGQLSQVQGKNARMGPLYIGGGWGAFRAVSGLDLNLYCL